MKKLLLRSLILVFGFSTLAPMNSRAQDDGPQLLRQPISVDNVRQIRELATLGYGEILDFNWSPNGDILLVATSTGIWSLNEGGESPKLFALPQTRVTSIAFSPDGAYLAASSSGIINDAVSIINIANGEIEETFEVRTGTMQIEYHPTHPILIIGVGYNVQFIRLDDGSIFRLNGTNEPPFAISPSGSTLVTYAYHSLNIWDFDEILQGNIAEPRVIDLPNDNTSYDNLNFLPDETRILKQFDVLDIETGEFIDRLRVHRSTSRNVTLSPDGNSIVAPDNERIAVFDATTLQPRFDVTLINGEPISVQINPDNDRYAATTLDGIVTGRIMVAQSDAIAFPFLRITPRELVFSPDQSILIVLHESTNILIWDIQSRDEFTIIPTDVDLIWEVSISPDGRWLTGLSRIRQADSWLVRPIVVNLETGDDHVFDVEGASQVVFEQSGSHALYVVSPTGLHLVDLETRQHETVIAVESPSRGAPDEIGRLLSPNQSLFLANHSVWNVHSKEVVWTFDISLGGRLDTVNWYQAFGFSSDSTELAIKVGFTTQYLYIWDMQTGEGTTSQQLRLDTCDVAFSPTDSLIAIVGQIWASGGGGNVSIWNFTDDSILGLLGSHVFSCYPALFTADGTLIIRAYESTDTFHGPYTGVSFWNMATRQQPYHIFFAGDPYVATLSLSSDNSLLAVATQSGIIRVFGMPLNSECYLTTQNSVNRRVRPTTQSRIIGNLNSADIEFPTGISIDDDGINWWHLQDDSWVIGEFVDVSDGCISIPIIAAE
jgi:WD40 repeat protein